jgi:3-methyl-2-oxobutanoate hydroxymethyltransferase
VKAVTIHSLRQIKEQGERFSCVTAYDASFARAAGDAGIEALLIGDSLGMVLHGRRDTLPVTVEHVAYHIDCVQRADTSSLLIGDMPFMSYATPGQAMDNAATLMRAGAQVVKLEGGTWLCESVQELVERGIPVCGHLGLTPQSVNNFGGFRVQARAPDQAQRLLDDALALEQAGACLLVLECIPVKLAQRVTESLQIPVIGIGAGPYTDAQVLVMHDLLGLNPRPARFVKNFLAGQDSIVGALSSYATAVRDGSFPAPEHCFE